MYGEDERVVVVPWSAREASSHNKNADTPKLKKIWASTANSVLEETGDEGRAVRVANGAVNRARDKASKSEAAFLLRLLRDSNNR